MFHVKHWLSTDINIDDCGKVCNIHQLIHIIVDKNQIKNQGMLITSAKIIYIVVTILHIQYSEVSIVKNISNIEFNKC